MKHFATTMLAFGIMLLALPATHANVILTYTGNDFTIFTPPYNGTDKVTASITLANPLGDNLNLLPVIPLTFSISDGVQTLTATPISTQAQVVFSTDATGNINAWIAAVMDDISQGEPLISTVNTPQIHLDQTDNTDAFAMVVDDPGTWTSTSVAVPEPPTVSVLCAGLLGLGLLWRRRRQILGLAQ